ncbi:MAG: tetratricopeptide repeat protein [Draconibacterium sp.]
MAEIYRSEDNLSKELSALESYVEQYGNDNQKVNERLFQLYAEISSWEKANGLWQKMSNASQQTESNLETFLEVNKKLDNNAKCDSIASALLTVNSDHFEALDWMAKKFYWAGQNRYDTEMEKYEQNKTRKQYALLLKELDLVTADFKKALPYLEKLWEQKPGKEYASYLANIYARFGDEKKVDFYKKYMN